MGIIIKQSIKGTIFSYIGVFLGFITIGILWPKLLTADQIGLINFLIALSTIFAQVGSLGLNSVTIRLFPYFRDKPSKHHGYLSFIVLFALAGFLLISVFYIFYRPVIIENNIEKSRLLINYIDYLLPFTFSLLLFNILDNYNKVLYDAVSGTFAKELLFRLLNFLLIVVYYFNIITFQHFVFIYFVIFSIPAAYLIYILHSRNELHFKFDFSFIKKTRLTRAIISVSGFGLIGGFGTLAIASIDKVMINSYLNLTETGYYSISVLFATLVLIPSRTLGKISGTLIADAWKKNDLEQINTIYKKSCINQLVVGVFIFLLIVTNLDVLYTIIPGEYEKGKMVIYFIGLANIFNMATGTNGIIIATSSYYRYQSVFVFLLLLFVIGSNILFIPVLGITGAAIASAISTFLFNLIRYIFLYVKFRFQPFDWRFPILIITGLLIFYYFNNYFSLTNTYIDFFANTILIMLVYGLFIYLFKISEDIEKVIDAVLNYLKLKK